MTQVVPMAFQFSKRLSQAEVKRRSRLVFFLLFEYIHPHLGIFNTLDQQQIALESFLRDHTNRAPRTARHQNVNYDGGAHTTDTLVKLIRATVQKHGIARQSSDDAISNFFQYGYKSVQQYFYHQVLDTVKVHHPDTEVIDRWPKKVSVPDKAVEECNEQADSEMVHGIHPAADVPILVATHDRRSHSDTETLCGDRLQAPSCMHKEVYALNRWYPEGWSKEPLQPRRADQRIPATTKAISAQPKRKRLEGTAKTTNPKCPKIGLQAASFRADTLFDEGKVVPGSAESEPRPTQLHTASANLAIPDVVFSDVKRKIESIDTRLWPALKTAFDQVGLSWHESAKLAMDPSPELTELYVICFGAEWKSRTVGLVNRAALQSLDVFVALVGAAIDLEVFKSNQAWDCWVPIMFPSEYHREVAIQFFEHNGMPFEELKRYFDVYAKRKAFLDSVVRPQAKLITSRLNGPLYEHLCEQRSSAKFREGVGALSSRITDGITRAIEIAMALMTELRASGEDVRSEWVLPGTRFAGECMVQSSQSGLLPLDENSLIAFALLPRIDLRTTTGEWQVASEAYVTVCPLSGAGSTDSHDEGAGYHGL